MKNGWTTMPLGQVVRHRKEFVTIDDLQDYVRCRVQLHAKGIILRDKVPGAEIKTKQQQVCRAGEFLVAEIDAKVGGFGIVPADLEGSIVSSHYFLFTVDGNQLDRRFLDYFVRTPAFREQVTAQGTTNYAAIRPSHVLGYTLPLPPLPEQRRIVAKVEELAAKVEEARALRTAIVKTVDAASRSATSIAFSLCGSDRYKPMDEIAEVRGGIQKQPGRVASNNPVRYLTVAHVQRNRILTCDPRFFEVSPDELARWRLKAGDVLIIEGNGSANQIGRTALFRGEIQPCVHQNHVIRIRPNRETVEPEYVNAFLNSPSGQDEVQSRSRTTSGLRSLSVGRIKQIRIPVPPLTEQRRVVAYLDDLQAKVDGLKALQAQTHAELDALLPSILDKAFKGESFRK